MLRVAVELVRNVASTLWMTRNRPPRDWHTDQTHASLPGETNDTQSGNHSAAPNSQPPSALMVSSAANAARPSNREPSVREADELVQWTNSSGERPERQRRAGVLTDANHKLPLQRDSQLLVPLIPAKAGIREQAVRKADELVQWTNSSGERPERKRRAEHTACSALKLQSPARRTTVPGFRLSPE
jgi:hypothetical protein